MGRHPVCCMAVVALCAAPAIAAELSPSGVDITSTVLTLAVADDCPASDAVIATAREEATRIWSRGDVRLRWVTASKLPFTAPKSAWLLIQCSTGASGQSSPNPQHLKTIAMIRFLDALPMNVITLSPHNASVLLDQDAREGRLQNHQFPAMRQLRLGRMLGRALAHEIGHFLSRSGAHTESGLMRATHSVAALTGLSLQPFTIGAGFPRLLSARRIPIDPLESREPLPQ